ncbi:MAG: D-alanine--D-alanine ligase [Candidatus Aminicenantes bacterium]|nr:MAG: D-alanine--D-alanine ligase [Candidatus Aminicenantes bacterium]
MAQKRIVALLFGGRSAEHEVSIISAGSIHKNLDKQKYAPSCIYINKRGFWRVVESPFLPQAELEKGPFLTFLPWGNRSSLSPIDADIYFPILHGPNGEDGTIQGLFEMADVPYVGATVLASAMGMDKAVAKSLFQEKGLPVVKHLVLTEFLWKEKSTEILDQIHRDFSFPFFVKPANMGSSVGITKVISGKQIQSAFQTAFQYDSKILLEQGIQGREIECSVLGNSNPEASLPGEIIPYRDFYDYKDKYIDGKTSFKIPVELPQDVTEKVQHLAIAAFRAIGCSGMARVDFFLEEETQKLFLNEINTIPGFTEISMYPKLWELSGLSYPLLLDKLIDLGFEQHKNKKREGAALKP